MKKDLRKTEINFIIDEWDRNFPKVDELKEQPKGWKHHWLVLVLAGLVSAIFATFLLTGLYIYLK